MSAQTGLTDDMAAGVPGGGRAVALFFYRLGGSSGGAERMIVALANGLASRGIPVRLVSWDADDAQTFYPLRADVRWGRLGFSPGVGDKIRRARALAAFLKRERVGVLIGFVMTGDKTVYAAAKMAGVRLVVAERNAPSMYRLRYGALQRTTMLGLLHLADRITVQLPAFADGYPRSIRNRIVVIGNPVEAGGQRAAPDRPDDTGRFTLLAVGRLEPVQKKFDVLVKAFGTVAPTHPAWDLEIVGEGPEQEKLTQLAEALGIGRRIRFIPPTKTIMQLYPRAHLFAIPSRWEGFSNALAEAMSHGLPAVGFREAQGVADLIGDDGGWLADGLDDPARLAESLDAAMSSPAERVRRGARAAERMSPYAPDRQLDRWVELVRSLVDVRP
jgi:GalNAc-alpha-(1->4)-GalNAc-alpha-(1->3)-diNAcBac-PP-undecaprenol alpha-1,4-N-acetyl-D-galactosaminyltransferase